MDSEYTMKSDVTLAGWVTSRSYPQVCAVIASAGSFGLGRFVDSDRPGSVDETREAGYGCRHHSQ